MDVKHKKLIVVIVLLDLALLYGAFLFLNREYDNGPEARDAKIKMNLSSLETEGVLYADSHASYSQFCEEKGKSYGDSVNIESVFECYDSEGAWAAGAILPTNGEYFCVDSKGTRDATIRGLKEGETECPSPQ
jgi:hypothetical protein